MKGERMEDGGQSESSKVKGEGSRVKGREGQR